MEQEIITIKEDKKEPKNKINTQINDTNNAKKDNTNINSDKKKDSAIKQEAIKIDNIKQIINNNAISSNIVNNNIITEQQKYENKAFCKISDNWNNAKYNYYDYCINGGYSYDGSVYIGLYTPYSQDVQILIPYDLNILNVFFQHSNQNQNQDIQDNIEINPLINAIYNFIVKQMETLNELPEGKKNVFRFLIDYILSTCIKIPNVEDKNRLIEIVILQLEKTIKNKNTSEGKDYIEVTKKLLHFLFNFRATFATQSFIQDNTLYHLFNDYLFGYGPEVLQIYLKQMLLYEVQKDKKIKTDEDIKKKVNSLLSKYAKQLREIYNASDEELTNEEKKKIKEINDKILYLQNIRYMFLWNNNCKYNGYLYCDFDGFNGYDDETGNYYVSVNDGKRSKILEIPNKKLKEYETYCGVPLKNVGTRSCYITNVLQILFLNPTMLASFDRLCDEFFEIDNINDIEEQIKTHTYKGDFTSIEDKITAFKLKDKYEKYLTSLKKKIDNIEANDPDNYLLEEYKAIYLAEQLIIYTTLLTKGIALINKYNQLYNKSDGLSHLYEKWEEYFFSYWTHINKKPPETTEAAKDAYNMLYWCFSAHFTNLLKVISNQKEIVNVNYLLYNDKLLSDVDKYRQICAQKNNSKQHLTPPHEGYLENTQEHCNKQTNALYALFLAKQCKSSFFDKHLPITSISILKYKDKSNVMQFLSQENGYQDFYVNSQASANTNIITFITSELSKIALDENNVSHECKTNDLTRNNYTRYISNNLRYVFFTTKNLKDITAHNISSCFYDHECDIPLFFKDSNNDYFMLKYISFNDQLQLINDPKALAHFTTGEIKINDQGMVDIIIHNNNLTYKYNTKTDITLLPVSYVYDKIDNYEEISHKIKSNQMITFKLGGKPDNNRILCDIKNNGLFDMNEKCKEKIKIFPFFNYNLIAKIFTFACEEILDQVVQKNNIVDNNKNNNDILKNQNNTNFKEKKKEKDDTTITTTNINTNKHRLNIKYYLQELEKLSEENEFISKTQIYTKKPDTNDNNQNNNTSIVNRITSKEKKKKMNQTMLLPINKTTEINTNNQFSINNPEKQNFVKKSKEDEIKETNNNVFCQGEEKNRENNNNISAGNNKDNIPKQPTRTENTINRNGDEKSNKCKLCNFTCNNCCTSSKIDINKNEIVFCDQNNSNINTYNNNRKLNNANNKNNNDIMTNLSNSNINKQLV